MKIMKCVQITLFSYLYHMIFMFFLFFHIFGPGSLDPDPDPGVAKSILTAWLLGPNNFATLWRISVS